VKCSGDCCDCFKWWELPLWVQHQFVGFEVAQEVAAAYYRIGPSNHFGHQENLRTMLSNDLFHLGIKPANQLRRLEIDLEEYNTPAELVALEEQLPSLLELRLKKGFDLVIMTRWHSRPCKTLRVLDKMVPVVTELKKAGVNVRAVASHLVFGKLDMPNILTLTSEQWIPTWRGIFKKAVLDRKPEVANPKNVHEREFKRLLAKFERYLDAPEWTGVEMDSDVTSSFHMDSASDEE
jgi:hypothetical protein